MQTETATYGLRYAKLSVEQMHPKSLMQLNVTYLHNSNFLWRICVPIVTRHVWVMLVNNASLVITVYLENCFLVYPKSHSI